MPAGHHSSNGSQKKKVCLSVGPAEGGRGEASTIVGCGCTRQIWAWWSGTLY